MRAYKILSLSVVTLLITVVFAGAVAVPAAAQSDTMQFRYNAAHTGDYSPVAGPVPPNGQLLWKSPTDGYYTFSPAVANGVVYVGASDQNNTGRIYAFDAATGQLKWKFPATGSLADNVLSSPAVGNNTVYVASEDRNVYALNASTGQQKWNFKTDGMVVSSPALVNFTVYVVSGSGGSAGNTLATVYALDAATGQQKWNFTTENAGTDWCSPAVYNNTVYVGGASLWDPNLYALNATTGALKWRFDVASTPPFTNTIESSPAVANGVVYVGGGGL
jgi:outer membrane protein assembly factor BamB